ncbi:hypothetical protein [Desulfoluna spongiiphila]|uniref:hypothetical protein n=1 Tax=Desulfoluna spongiiphila TaxID=419481 RepID=UPI00125696FA|nr:hypothetical protein [Desulfoluna spongiiphila]VVS91799.1 prokaryotic membrane lipoprotein lipid attachment site profile [Desulfoluna spongiiphila]
MVRKQVGQILAAVLLVFLVACSGDEETETPRMYDAQREALEQAREVEAVLQKADEKRREEIEEMETH